MTDGPRAEWKGSPFLEGRNGSSVVRVSPNNHGYWRRELRELREIVAQDIDEMDDNERAAHFERIRRFNQRQSVSPISKALVRKAQALDSGEAEH